MAGGPQITVRQVASYPQAPVGPADLVLTQQGGQGGPYNAPSAYQLISQTLEAGPGAISLGYPIPAGAVGNQFFAAQSNYPTNGGIAWNGYINGGWTNWNGGASAFLGWGEAGGLFFLQGPNLPAGQSFNPLDFTTLFTLSPAGAMALPRGTLTVARDPGSAFDVVTLGFMGRSTVASFNGRKGVVTLAASDIYAALGICPPDTIATMACVNEAICAAINDALRMHPGVWSWMGRVGDVFLTVADMNFAAANNPSFQPPLTIPEPPATATDGEVVTASWVIQFLGGTSGFATEAWVQNYVALNTVTSFNGRLGAITLTLADIQGAGGAPSASPQFSGVPTVPTAPAGNSTGQIASTAFVMAAVSNATAGVASFNGRTGTVTLNSTDIGNAGGALINSPAFTGLPTAPTPAAGNNSTLIATTAFVTAAIAAAGGVTSFNTRTGAVTLTLGDVTGVGGAPINSPALTGTPTAPTPATGTDNTEIATTAFVNAAISSIGIGVTSFEGRTGAVTLQANDISAAGGLINPSVNLTGVPTAPTATAGTSSTQIATTAFVNAAIIAGSVTTFNGRAGAVTLAAADLSGAGGALLASPAFTGTPVAPTAAPGTNTTQLATCAFVTAALTTQAANSVTSFNGRQGVVTLTTADITGAGGAPIASPTFTGTPSVPTATAGTSTTQAASTAFVMAAIAASTAGVTSFNSRTGAVTLQTNDVSAVGGALLASPTFTGTPSAPTPAAGNNSTQLATTAFVANALSTAAVTSFNTRTGAVSLQLSDITGAGGAPIASPTFTGTPAGPTATAGTNTTQLATTAFVQSAVASYLPLTGGTVTGNMTIDGLLTMDNTINTSIATAIAYNNSNWTTQSIGFGIDAGLGGFPGFFGVRFGTGTGGVDPTGTTYLIRSFGISGSWNQVVALAVNTANQAVANTTSTITWSWSVAASDPRLKQNVAPPEKDALDIVNAIPVSQCDYRHPEGATRDEHWDFTVMADEVERLLPHAYMAPPTNEAGEETGYANVHPLHLITVLWRAVQQLSEKLDALPPQPA